jgi:hypothetical protein
MPWYKSVWALVTVSAAVGAWAVGRLLMPVLAADEGWTLLGVVGAAALVAVWAACVYRNRFPAAVTVRAVGVAAWAVSVFAHQFFAVTGLWADLYVWGPIMYFGLVRADKFLRRSEAGLHDSERVDSVILAGVAALLAFAGWNVMPDGALALVLAVAVINLAGASLPNVTIATPRPDGAGSPAP